MRSKILVTGAGGQLGSDFVSLLSEAHRVIGLAHEDCDIRDQAKLIGIFEDIQPSVVIHTAAFTNVDAAEEDAELCYSVNETGSGNVARACGKVKAWMINFSTDYVFDGKSDRAYHEEDNPSPETVYGKSKLAAELTIQENIEDFTTIRVAWLYGKEGSNFVKTMLRLASYQSEKKDSGGSGQLRVVDDQLGNPTWTEDVVRQTIKLLEMKERGVFHATAQGETTWYDFACDIFEELALKVEIDRCTTEQMPRPALRPRMSSLENRRLKTIGVDLMPDYKEALGRFLSLNRKELFV